MFREDREYADEQAALWFRRLMSSKIGRIVCNHELAGMDPRSPDEDGHTTYRRMFIASYVRSQNMDKLMAEGRGLIMEKLAEWRLCTVDARVLHEAVRSRKSICNLIDVHIGKVNYAIEHLVYINHAGDFEKLVEQGYDLRNLANKSAPNKKMKRKIRQLERAIPDF